MSIRQTGGMDPGLAALIAAVLSGSVTAYGVSTDTRSKEDMLKEKLDQSIKDQLANAEKRVAEAEQLSTATADATKKIADLQKEVDELKKANQDLQSKASTLTEADRLFKSANSEVLKKAGPLVIQKLSSKYNWIQRDGSNVPKTLKALEYPTTYQGRLSRMSLYDFFQKRVLKAMAEDQNPTKGGRRRYRKRRGGKDTPEEIKAKELALAQEAPEVSAEATAKTEAFLNDEEAAPPFAPVPAPPAPGVGVEVVDVPVPATAPPSIPTLLPSYEDFVVAYTEAIKDATASIPTARQKRDAALEAKRESLAKGKQVGDEIAAREQESLATGKRIGADIVAKKAAATIVAQFDTAIKEGEEALATPVPEELVEEVREKKRVLGEKIDSARELVGNPAPGEVPVVKKKRFGFFGGASNLREVETEADWKELNMPKSSKEILEELKTATKTYKNAVAKAVKKGPKVEPEPAGPAMAPVEDAFSVENPLLAAKKAPAPAPAAAAAAAASEPAMAPVEDAFSVENPLLAPKEAPAPAPAAPEAVPVLKENVDLVNPLLVGETGKTPAELLSNPLRPGQVLPGEAKQNRKLTRGLSFAKKRVTPSTRRPRKGGSRKRTLKKRRGGK